MTDGPILFGRSRELSVIGDLLASARAGAGGALVISGDVGAGKSALLDHARSVAAMRTISATGDESESPLPFAAAHMLLRTTFGRIDALPARQADAIRAAFGLGPPTGGERLLLGLAGLTLVSEFAGGEPLLCLVDDAQWLDRASADLVLFMIRRLGAEGVALIVATRAGEGAFAGSGVPVLRLAGLADADAARLLRTAVGELPAEVRDRVIAEAGGNPLALIEVAAHLSAGQRAGQLMPLALHVTAGAYPVGRLQAVFWDRVRRLPAPTRTLLLVAAADDSGDLGTVLRAAHRLGAALPDLAAAERDGLVEIAGPALAFRHPLIRPAVYRCVPAAERVAAHQALAAAYTDPARGDRRAWHRAAASLEPDAEVAADLAAAAEMATVRGGHAEASVAYERAAELAIDPGTRSRLLAAAAAAARDAGRPAQVITLVDLAGTATDDPVTVARLTRLRADAEFEQLSPRQATLTLIAGAALVAGHDPAAARSLLVEAGWRAWYAGEAAPAAEAALPADPGLDGLRAALRDPSGGHDPAAAALLCVLTGDDDAGWALVTGLVVELRGGGRLGRLPVPLAVLASAELFRGDHVAASVAAADCVRLAADTGQPRRGALGTAVLAMLAAIGGHEQRYATLAGELARYGPLAALGTWAGGLLDLGLGRYAAALRRLGQVPASALAPLLPALVAPDLVEAAVRAGRLDLAGEPLAQFADWAAELRRPWADAVLLRCRALAAGGAAAEDLYQAAVAQHARGGRPFERARTELVFGEWLRRARHRARARIHLTAALEIFDRMGAGPWAGRARMELAAIAEPAGPGLTSQELRIVRLAAGRLTNRDIAAQMFLSPRTVEYHLYRAYRKLGVSARGELAQLDLDSAHLQ